MATAEDMLQALDELLTDGARRRVLHVDAEDERLDGRTITVDGRPLVNFGSCSYLGLETHPAIKAGVIDAVERFGTQFSSSRAYASSPAYALAEGLLEDLFDRPTIITPSTTMGHLSTMPTVIGATDVLLLDHQVHHSVQTAAKLVQAQGTHVELVRHNDFEAIDRKLTEFRRTRRRVWYAADGLYSMYADFLPVDAVQELVRRHDNLWLYLDDAHAAGWTGRFGRGHWLERLDAATLERSVVALSLNKSFAAAGGAITFPKREMRRRVFTCGGPLIFSGPVQPPMLGAILASARLHTSPEIVQRQQLLLDRIRLFNSLAREQSLPLVSASEAPIRCVGAGITAVAYRLVERLRDHGLHVNSASFPAVAAKRSGARVTLTAHHSEADIRTVIEALAEELPRALREESSGVEDLRRAFSRQLSWDVRLRDVAAVSVTAPSSLVMESHDSIEGVDHVEWDSLLSSRGSFDVNALRMLERTFGTSVPGEIEHEWAFRYLLVRDADTGRAVAATFFTTALWKDDMLSPEGVSAQVEPRRVVEPYYLTSRMVGMGSLLSEGNHLYLDRDADWRGAMRLVLQAARTDEDRYDAAALVLRDLPDVDAELHDFLSGEGFFRVPVHDTWVKAVDFTDDVGFLAGLRSRDRRHQRKNVLVHEPLFSVEVLSGGASTPSPEALDHLHTLYRNVHSCNLELNVFPLPRRILDAIVATHGWELLVLRLPDVPQPVAFVALHVAADHVDPVFCGLDYDYVASHGAYQQTILQSLRAAQRHGLGRVHYGMAAELHKRRFGAKPERRWVYIQATDTYNTDVLMHVPEVASA